MGGSTWKPTTAGILSIIAGVLGMIFSIIFTLVGVAIASIESLSVAHNILPVVIPAIILSSVAITGGVHALSRRK